MHCSQLPKITPKSFSFLFVCLEFSAGIDSLALEKLGCCLFPDNTNHVKYGPFHLAVDTRKHKSNFGAQMSWPLEKPICLPVFPDLVFIFSLLFWLCPIVTHLKFSEDKGQPMDREERNSLLLFRHIVSKPSQRLTSSQQWIKGAMVENGLTEIQHMFSYHIKHSQLKSILNDQWLGSKFFFFSSFYTVYTWFYLYVFHFPNFSFHKCNA